MRTSSSLDFLTPAPSLPTSELGLLAGQDSGQLDTLVSGGVYAVVPQSPPARYPLWAGLLREATRDGKRCHVLVRTPAPDFLERLSRDGWPEAREAWMDERLRIYPMVEDFSIHLFRLDMEGLTAEFGYWGLGPGELLLVDAADELLSLHDVTLATNQLAKLRHWVRSQNLPVLLNFTLGASAAGLSSLTRLMDNLSGLARIHGDPIGPVLTLEYWQGALGTAAERTLPLAQGPAGYMLRPERLPVNAPALSVPLVPPASGASVAPDSVRHEAVGAPVIHYAQDQVWARELQMLTGQEWRACAAIADMAQACADQEAPLLVLRFGADSALADLAASVHRLRTQLGALARIVVAEHRVSLRYANEMMLLRLGANAIIRQDIPLARWPAALGALKGQPPRAMPDVDVKTAMTNAASPQSRGYLVVPDFLAQLHEAQERSRVLDVPFALAVIKPVPHSIGHALAAARFRRNGDFITTDGHQMVVFFSACSLTRGQQVLDSTFEGQAERFVRSVDWMSSERDVDGLIASLFDAHARQPFNLTAYDEDARAAEAALAPLSVQPPDEAFQPVLHVDVVVPVATAEQTAQVEQVEPAEHVESAEHVDPVVDVPEVAPLPQVYVEPEQEAVACTAMSQVDETDPLDVPHTPVQQVVSVPSVPVVRQPAPAAEPVDERDVASFIRRLARPASAATGAAGSGKRALF